MHKELVIIGAGPAGLSAGIEAARAGVNTLVIDENHRPGGQLFKQMHKFFGSGEHSAGIRGYRIGERLLEKAKEAGVELQLGYPVYGIFPEKKLICGSPEGVGELQADKIIIASGANEKTLCFEGCSLPGVMTAGAAQTMVNLYHVKPGDHVVMIGTGNVGLVVGYQLLQAGIHVEAMVEAGPCVNGYQVHADKLRRCGVPFFLSHTIKRAVGSEGVEAVEIVQVDDHMQMISGTEKRIKADMVCLAVGLTPMTELAQLAGCRMQTGRETAPWHDENMMTSVEGIYIAGDVSGVEEASIAMEEGKLAGISAARDLGAMPECQAEEMRALVRKSLEILREKETTSERQNIPSRQRRKLGPVACIECRQSIPCDPCRSACPRGAISIEGSISHLPHVDENLCNGCGICAARCSGQAIFIVDESSETEARVTIPYEFLPVPEKGQNVRCLDRDGRYVTEGTVENVKSAAAFDHTRLVTVSLPKAYSMDVRQIDAEGEDSSTEISSMKNSSEIDEDKIIVCRCEEVTVGDIRRAIAEGADSIRALKLRTHSGMGACQGMTCGLHLERLLRAYAPEAENGAGLPRRFPVRRLGIEEVYRLLEEDHDM